MAKHLADYLTLPGRILALVTLLLFCGALTWYIIWMLDGLPLGSYPLFFFVFPILLGAGAFFLFGSWTLKALGIRVFKDPN